MAKSLQILDVGMSVAIGGDPEPIPAMITAVEIGLGRVVRYRVAWWNGRCRSEEMLNADEILIPPPTPTQKIGFLSRIQEQS
jgi:hypothetical protein